MGRQNKCDFLKCVKTSIKTHQFDHT